MKTSLPCLFLFDRPQVMIIHKDEKGDPVRATRLVVDMFNENVSMIIGPENFCKYEAHVATAVGLPIFSYVSDTQLVSCEV